MSGGVGRDVTGQQGYRQPQPEAMTTHHGTRSFQAIELKKEYQDEYFEVRRAVPLIEGHR